jgi:hypothetical protein
MSGSAEPYWLEEPVRIAGQKIGCSRLHPFPQIDLLCKVNQPL